jgi:hypothetical protein
VLDTGYYDYSYMTDEEKSRLDFSASITLTCHRDDTGWAELVSGLLHERGHISTPDGFSVMPVDADNQFHMRAVSVPHMSDQDVEDLTRFFLSLPWREEDLARMIVLHNGARYIC